MILYALQLIVVATAAVLTAVRGREGKILYLTTSFAVLIVLSALRSTSVGSDTATYAHVFSIINNARSLSDAYIGSDISAPVYVAYNWLASFIGNYQLVLLINSLIIGIGVARFIKLLSANVAFSVVLFILLAFYFQSLNGMRQYVSIALAANALYSFTRYGLRSLSGWILFLLSLGVHNTAAVMLPCFLAGAMLKSSENPKKCLLAVSACSVVAAPFIKVATDLFLTIFPRYSMYNGSANIDIFSEAYGGRIVFLYLFLGCFVLLALFYVYKDDNRVPNSTICILPTCIFSVVLGIAFSKSFLINRILWYLTLTFIVLIPNTITLLPKRLAPLAQLFTIIGAGIWWAAQLIEDQHHVIPYEAVVF